jgi:hypothetical protein
MTIEQSDGACIPSFSSAELERFEAWWAKHGQFCRAGGGGYEKTFAFRAWEAATKEEREVCAKVCEGLLRDGEYQFNNAVQDCVDLIRERSN